MTDLAFKIFGERKRETLEEGFEFAPKFDADGLIPCIASDYKTGELLMVAYMNKESLAKTLEIGEAVYYSRSRKEIWHKGLTSGHTQKIVEIRTDCDQDAIWIRVDQQGSGACHVGYESCFYRVVPFGKDFKKDQISPLKPTGAVKTFDPKKVYGSKSK